MLKTPWAPALRLLCRARHKPLLAAFKRLLLLPALAPALSPPARHPWTHPQPSGHPLLTLPRLQTRAGPAALALWSLWTCARPRTRSITWTRRSTGGARSRWVPAAWSDAAHGERGGGRGAPRASWRAGCLSGCLLSAASFPFRLMRASGAACSRTGLRRRRQGAARLGWVAT